MELYTNKLELSRIQVSELEWILHIETRGNWKLAFTTGSYTEAEPKLKPEVTKIIITAYLFSISISSSSISKSFITWLFKGSSDGEITSAWKLNQSSPQNSNPKEHIPIHN